MVCGSEHEANAAESTRHWNVDPGSLESNPNVGVGSLVRPVGPESKVVSGRCVSTSKLRVAGLGSAVPPPSTARTSKVCPPSDSCAVVWGVEHEAKAAVSTRHSKLEPASLDSNSNAGVASPVVPLGPSVMLVSGGTATVKLRLAGV